MHALFKVSPKNLIKVKIYLMILVSSAMKLQCRHKKTLKEGIQHEIRGIETWSHEQWKSRNSNHNNAYACDELMNC